MVAVPLLSGMTGAKDAEFQAAYPLNLEPVPVDSGLSKGQLRMTAGVKQFGNGPGNDRGGITWNGTVYRVMGTKLVRINSDLSVTIIGDVGGEGPVRFDYSFTHLGIRSGTALWLFDGSTLAQVTDPDLGIVKDALWIDGYWMTTDGTYVPVTELNDPFQVKPLKYGSAEEDPDPITGLMKIRNRALIVGRYTIQIFRNEGGTGFPFATERGSTAPYGCVSATAKAYVADTFAFVGGPRSNEDETIGVYVYGQATAEKISTRTIDDALAAEPNVEGIVCETRSYRDEQRLFVHLTNETWVFFVNASRASGEKVWMRAASADGKPYRPRNAVVIGGKHMVGDLDGDALGWLGEDLASHFGQAVMWEFQTGYLYNAGAGGIVKSLELVGLPGRVPPEDAATAFLSMSRDGVSWSQERAINMGRAGERSKRIQWRPHSRFTNYLGLRFRGYNRALPGFARLEADIVPL